MLVIRVFEDEGKTKVYLSTERRRDSSRAKIVRRLDNGKPLCGVLEALVQYEEGVADLDSLVQAAFDLGRGYDWQNADFIEFIKDESAAEEIEAQEKS